MPTIDDYAKQAATETRRWYGRVGGFNAESQAAPMPLEDWYRQHWASFPATSPDGGKIIDNELPDLLDG